MRETDLSFEKLLLHRPIGFKELQPVILKLYELRADWPGLMEAILQDKGKLKKFDQFYRQLLQSIDGWEKPSEYDLFAMFILWQCMGLNLFYFVRHHAKINQDNQITFPPKLRPFFTKYKFVRLILTHDSAQELPSNVIHLTMSQIRRLANNEGRTPVTEIKEAYIRLVGLILDDREIEMSNFDAEYYKHEIFWNRVKLTAWCGLIPVAMYLIYNIVSPVIKNPESNVKSVPATERQKLPLSY